MKTEELSPIERYRAQWKPNARRIAELRTDLKMAIDNGAILAALAIEERLQSEMTPPGHLPPAERDKLKTHEAYVQQVIKDYQAKCDETAAKYAEDETETGQQLYWRADGASDAMDALLTLVASPPRQPDETEPSHLWPLAPFWTDDKPEGAGK